MKLTREQLAMMHINVQAVRVYYKGAYVVRNETQATYYIAPDAWDMSYTNIGVGTTEAEAWQDAADNCNRKSIEQAEQRGSPTWSLASDERYRKHGEVDTAEGETSSNV